MFSESVSDEVNYVIDKKNSELINLFIPKNAEISEYDIEGLKGEVLRIYGINFILDDHIKNDPKINPEKILNLLGSDVKELFDGKIKLYGSTAIETMQKDIFLLTIDRLWKDHLYTLDKIRQSIGLRAYGQKDPLLEFKREAYNLFEILMNNVDEETISVLAKVKISVEDNKTSNRIKLHRAGDNLHEMEQRLIDGMDLVQKQKSGLIENVGRQETVVSRTNMKFDPNNKSTWGRIGRNSLCPCGSGRKYKQCCGSD
jgi:preprotein translocase subunit SecA